MKPLDIKLSTYIDFNKENNEKDPKFKICRHVRISKYKNIFAREDTPNWSEEVFVIKKLKILSCRHVINDLILEETVETFYKKELQKTDQKDFITEKVIKRKGDKLHVK